MSKKANETMTSIEEMEDKKILFAAMHERGAKQTQLAHKLGMQQASLSGNMNRTRIGLEVFTKILNALEYDVVVTDRATGENVWKVKI